MSGKENGLGQRLLVGGFDISGDISALDAVAGGPALLDVTDITQSAHSRLGGLRDGKMGLTEFFDSVLAHPVLDVLPVTDTVMMWLLGPVFGNPAACLNAKQIGYDPDRGADGALALKTQGVGSGFGLEWGLQLTPGVRTDTAATHGTALGNGASSAFGAQAYLELAGLTGTDCTVVVEHSADNTTFTTLGSFTAATGPNKFQRIAVAGTVNRWVRVSSTTTGGFTSASFAVVFCRNPVAVAF